MSKATRKRDNKRLAATAAAAKEEKKKRPTAKAGAKAKSTRARKTDMTATDASMESVTPATQSAAASRPSPMALPTHTGAPAMPSSSTAPSNLLPTPPPVRNHCMDPSIVQQRLKDQQQRLMEEDRVVTELYREDARRRTEYEMRSRQTMAWISRHTAGHNGRVCVSDWTGAAAYADNGGPGTAFADIDAKSVVHDADDAVSMLEAFDRTTDSADARTAVDHRLKKAGEPYYSAHDARMFDDEQGLAYVTGGAAVNDYEVYSRSVDYQSDHCQSYPHMPPSNPSPRVSAERDFTPWGNMVSDDGFGEDNTGHVSYGPEDASTSKLPSASFAFQGADYNDIRGFRAGVSRGADFGANTGLRPISEFDENFNGGHGTAGEDWESDLVQPPAPTWSAAQWRGVGYGAYDAL